MKVRELMQDSEAVNLLKEISEGEAKNGTSYVKASELKNRQALPKLETSKLVLVDKNGEGTLISTSTKGKKVIALVDQLKDLLENNNSKKRITIEYE